MHRSAVYQRETQRSFGTFLLPSVVFVPWFPYLVSRLGASPAGTVATAMLCVGWFVGGLALLRRGARWRAEALALACPSCRAPFVGRGRSPDDGGRCRRCGAVVITPPGAAARALFTRPEFARRLAGAARAMGRVAALWMGLVFASVVVPTFLGFARLLDSAYGLGIVLLVGGGGIAFAMLETVRRRRARLECPDCGRLFVDQQGDVALDDGRCPGCGLAVVDDLAETPGGKATRAHSLPGGASRPSSAGDLTERYDQVETATQIDYVVAALVAAAGLAPVAVFYLRGAHVSLVSYRWTIVGLFVAIVWLLLADRRWQRRARQRGLACPNCGELLVGGENDSITRAVLARGACMHCGTRFWDASV